jgi:hypothetical protein
MNKPRIQKRPDLPSSVQWEIEFPCAPCSFRGSTQTIVVHTAHRPTWAEALQFIIDAEAILVR